MIDVSQAVRHAHRHSTFVLHVASSCRSQVAVRAASATAWLTWERPSVDARWRPPLAMAIGVMVLQRTTTSMRTVGIAQGQRRVARLHQLSVAAQDSSCMLWLMFSAGGLGAVQRLA